MSVGRGWVSGDEVEGVGVGGLDGAEVAVVEGGDGGVVEAFSDSDDGGVDDVQAEIGVGGLLIYFRLWPDWYKS